MIADSIAEIDEIKKKSATCREQAERALFAKSAMLYAIASGSLRLYGEVLRWSRRYIRDPVGALCNMIRDTLILFLVDNQNYI